MSLYPVGVSSYGELRGRTQYVTDPGTAAQVRSLIAESRGVFAGGAVLSVNEGVRSRPDQKTKLDAWLGYQRGGPWAPLAASPLYTSTHDESYGSALDFGVTMPDGRNRAMTMSEHSWVVARGKLRGIQWTGRTFRPTPEQWHFNGGYPATLPPLPDTASGGATPFPTSEEDDMSAQDIIDIKNALTFQRKQLEGVTNILNADDGGGIRDVVRDNQDFLKAIQATLNNVEQIVGGPGGIANNANATVGALAQIAPLIVGLAGKPAGTVDVAALSKQIVAGLAPLVAAQAGTLTDAELQRIAAATADEQARRLKS